MKTPSAEPARAQEPRLEERIEAFDRYATLVAAQLAALEEDDIVRVAQLAAARDELATEIDAGPDLAGMIEVDDADPAISSPDLPALIAGARLALMESAEATEAIERRLQALRRETLAEIDALTERETPLRQYLETERGGEGRLDLRL